LHRVYLYRVIRIGFLLWIQIDYCQNSTILLNFLAPVLDQNRQVMDEVVGKIDNRVDATYGKIIENLKTRSGDFLQGAGSGLISTVLSLASNVTSSVKQKSSAVLNKNNNNENASKPNINNKQEKENEEHLPTQTPQQQ